MEDLAKCLQAQALNKYNFQEPSCQMHICLSTVSYCGLWTIYSKVFINLDLTHLEFTIILQWSKLEIYFYMLICKSNREI